MNRKKVFLGGVFILSSAIVYAAWPNWKKLLSSPTKPKTATIVAGVRGLDTLPEGKGDNTSRDWAALEKMESYSLSAEELNKFIQEGGLK